MYQMITNEARDRILEEAIQSSNVHVTYAKRDGDPFYIFDGWDDVHKLEAIASSMVTAGDLEEGYTWADFEEAIGSESNKIWRAEWAIGEFGFSDQFRVCDHCREAIDMEAIYVNYWLHQDLGDLLCYTCLAANPEWQGEYLDYCAMSGANAHRDGWQLEISEFPFIQPMAHGWIPLGYDAQIECFPDDSPHAEFDDRLTYANEDDYIRLYRAAELIDPEIQLLIQRGKYSQNIVWGRFNPYGNNEDAFSDRRIFNYVIGLVFAKYQKLRVKAHGIQLVKSAQK